MSSTGTHQARERGAHGVLLARAIDEARAELGRVGEDHVARADPQIVAIAPRRAREQAYRRFDPLHRRDLGEGVGELGAAHLAVEEAAMDRIGAVLVALQPVARRVDRVRHQLAVLGIDEGVVNREVGQLVGRAHVGEHQPLVLLHPIGALEDRLLELAVRRLARRLQAGAVHIVSPAVIAAAQPSLLRDAVFERSAAVRAVSVQQPVAPASVAEQHQVLTHDADRQRAAR